MAEPLSTLTLLFGLTFVVGSMLSMGLSLTIKMIWQSMKSWKIVALSLTVNFLIIPIVVIGLTSLLPLPEDVKIGFIIISLAAGAPFLPKIAQFAKANIAFAVGLMTLLMVATVIVLPIALPFVLPGSEVSALAVAKPLVFLMLLPLGIALAIRQRYSSLAEQGAKLLNPLTTFSMVALIILVFITYWREIYSTVGTGAILFSTFFVALALALGYLLGTKDAGVKRVSSLSAGARNIAAGILVATVNFPDQPMIALTILVMSLVGLVFLMVAAGEWGRKASAQEAPGQKAS
ncbi:TPA: bile acid:sodium symporter family protein [Candidatus Bathyarchaeota archaeon]|nr:bile acid:sodium symporter family protein [Candidatus Bathyarchaeota archaeon]